MSKHKFIMSYLYLLVTAIAPEVEYLRYHKLSSEEYVEIHYINGHVKMVTVTGDSLKAIAIDVLNKI